MTGFELRAFAALVETLLGVFPQERMLTEADLCVVRMAGRPGLDPDQALVGQGFEQVAEIDPEIALRFSDRTRFLDRPTAVEDRQPPEESALRVGQEVV